MSNDTIGDIVDAIQSSQRRSQLRNTVSLFLLLSCAMLLVVLHIQTRADRDVAILRNDMRDLRDQISSSRCRCHTISDQIKSMPWLGRVAETGGNSFENNGLSE